MSGTGHDVTSPGKPVVTDVARPADDERAVGVRAGAGRAEGPVVGDPAGPPVERGGRTVAFLTLLVAVWVVISPTALSYPLKFSDRDTAIWSSELALVLGILAVARLRAPGRTPRSAVLLVLGSALLVILPLLTFGRTPPEGLGVVWWNLLLSGAVLLVLSLAGLAQLARAGGLRRARGGPKGRG